MFIIFQQTNEIVTIDFITGQLIDIGGLQRDHNIADGQSSFLNAHTLTIQHAFDLQALDFI